MKTRYSHCSQWLARCFAVNLFLASLVTVAVLCPQLASAQQATVQKLTLSQIENLILHGVPDAALAAQIERRGLAFTPTTAIIDALRAKGAGPLTIAAFEGSSSKSALSTAARGDMLYILSSNRGLIEISPSESKVMRIARTSIWENGHHVAWNVRQSEFYVVPGGAGGNEVSVIPVNNFAETTKMKDSDILNTYSAALSPDGSRLYIISDQGTLETLRLSWFNTRSRTRDAATHIYGHTIAVSPDGNHLYVAGDDTLAEYDASLRLLRQQSIADLVPLAVSLDSQFLFALQQNKILRISTVSLGIDKSLTLPETVSVARETRGKLLLSRDNRHIFVAGRGAIYRIPLSLDSYTQIRPPHPGTREFEFAESGDHRNLYVLGDYQEGSLWIINQSTGQLLKTIQGIDSSETLICVPAAH